MGGKKSTLKERGDLAKTCGSLAVGELELDTDDLEVALERCGSNLRTLDASNNSIKSVPKALTQYTSLKQLNLATNRISTLPPEVNASSRPGLNPMRL